MWIKLDKLMPIPGEILSTLYIPLLTHNSLQPLLGEAEFETSSYRTYFRGYILRATSIPGQYERKAARAVSSKRPNIKILFLG